MKLNAKLIKEINEAFEEFQNQRTLDISPQDLEIGDETIYLDFPRDTIEIGVAELLKYIHELKSINHSTTRVTSEKFTQYPVHSSHTSLEFITSEINFSAEIKGEYSIRIVENPILIGIGATILGFWDKYFPPCSQYTAVEIEYESSDRRMNDPDELKIVKAFLFEFSHFTGHSIELSEIYDSDFGYYEEEVVVKEIKINQLPDFSEGMDLYLKAMGTEDPEIRFLYFYKIIEYYSPVAARRIAYDALTRKLDSIRFNEATNKDLKSILSISERFRSSQTDKELAQTLLSSSIDIVDLIDKLPERIVKSLTRQHNFKKENFNYESKPDVTQNILNTLGTILYSTRNSIVHAKSNYISDGNECLKADLPVLNDFLRSVTYNVINWYNRLPKHTREQD